MILRRIEARKLKKQYLNETVQVNGNAFVLTGYQFYGHGMMMLYSYGAEFTVAEETIIDVGGV